LYVRVIRQIVRMRFQVVCGLIFAVVVPALIGDLRAGQETFKKPLGEHFDPSFLATLMAFSLGFLIFRKVTSFPGVRASAYLLPTFFASYGLASLYFFALRSQFSMVQMAISFVSTCAFFYFVFFLIPRARDVVLCVVPTGDTERLRKITAVKWRFLTSPEEGRRIGAPIVVDLQHYLSPDWERFIADSALAGRPIYNAKDVAESITGRVQIDHISENTFGAVSPSAIYGPLKRYLDYSLALLAVVAFCWLFVLIAIAVRLDSRGPSLFKQERMGYRGRPFQMYKFRSMREALPTAGYDALTHDEARITRLGHFLRKWRLDELPQLFNVLRGEMSWIGPRPEAMGLSRTYEANLSFYRYRHIVRPGLTGWAQVSQGHVVGVDHAKIKLQYDFFYVKHFSLWLDVLVVLRTIRVVLTGFGSR
jgi:lipopolysaccharide/colanic/teichoic acid biosynthesis glycosyltransferase